MKGIERLVQDTAASEDEEQSNHNRYEHQIKPTRDDQRRWGELVARTEALLPSNNSTDGRERSEHIIVENQKVNDALRKNEQKIRRQIERSIEQAKGSPADPTEVEDVLMRLKDKDMEVKAAKEAADKIFNAKADSELGGLGRYIEATRKARESVEEKEAERSVLERKYGV